MMSTAPTRRLTVAQALVTYLSRQHSVAGGQRRRLIPATMGMERTRQLTADWSAVRAAAIDPDRPFDPPALETTAGLRAEYESDIASQRRYG